MNGHAFLRSRLCRGVGCVDPREPAAQLKAILDGE